MNVTAPQTITVGTALHHSKNPCTCDECHATRVLHWWCSHCGSGPHRFERKPFLGRRYFHDAKGKIISVHYWCSRPCRIAEEREFLLGQLKSAQSRQDLTAARAITSQLDKLGTTPISGGERPGIDTTDELVLGAGGGTDGGDVAGGSDIADGPVGAPAGRR